MTTTRLKLGSVIVEFNLLLLQSGLETFMASYPGSDLEALVEYGVAIGPDYRAWAELIAAEEPAIQAAHQGEAEALCTLNLAGDTAQIERIVSTFESTTVPDVAADVQQLLVGGARAWLEGLYNAREYCAAEQEWQKTVYLGVSLVQFDLGVAGFAGAALEYTAAMEQAWQDLW